MSRAGLAPASGSGSDDASALALLAHDRHGDLQRLLVVEARVDGRAVGALQVDLGQFARAAGALGDVFAGQLQVDAAQARFHLFDRVASFVRAITAHQPLVLVLDDLHWADTPSLLLLQFLAREIGEIRLLLVGAFRDWEARSPHPL